ncbi:hypothetical protein K438DRAFT_2172512 [Mycena galopus ATCC 62051]|nr:hypothetical protein K438DRAFT_2172512 [Mycena galopus ATCC 62051]
MGLGRGRNLTCYSDCMGSALQTQITRLKARERNLSLEHAREYQDEEEKIRTKCLPLVIRCANAHCGPTSQQSPHNAYYERTELHSDEDKDEIAGDLLATIASDSEIDQFVIHDHPRMKPDPQPEDEYILRSVVMLFGGEAEQHLTFVDHHGNLYVRIREPAADHYLSPVFHRQPRDAMELALAERDLETRSQSRSIQSTRLLRDTSPRLLPGEVFHERLASLDPGQDNDSAALGFRVQMLFQHVENLSNVNCKTIFDSTQPSRLRKDIACLSAQVAINGTLAYMLFDSITPEFVRATNCKSIPLDE